MDAAQAIVEVGEVIVAAIPKIIELFKHGGRDAVLTALDAGLAGARAKTDADLEAKHHGDHAGGNPPPPVTPPDHSTR